MRTVPAMKRSILVHSSELGSRVERPSADTTPTCDFIALRAGGEGQSELSASARTTGERQALRLPRTSRDGKRSRTFGRWTPSFGQPNSWLHCAKRWRGTQSPPRLPARGPRRRPIVENFRDQDLTGHLEFVAEGLPGGDPEQGTGDLRSFLWRPVWQTAIEHVLRDGQFDGFLPSQSSKKQ